MSSTASIINRSIQLDFERQTVITNSQHCEDLLSLAFPSLWRIQQALQDTCINPEVLPTLIRAMASVITDTGLGRAIVEIERKGKEVKVSSIRSQAIFKCDLPAIIPFDRE